MSSSLPPANSPVAEIISWPLQPSLPPPPVDGNTTPPPLQPIVLPAPFASPPAPAPEVGDASPPPAALPEITPFISPPSPPTTVVLPPVNSVSPPIATPPLTSPIIISPPAPPLVVVAPPPPPPPPLKAIHFPPIIPVRPPLPLVTSPPFPTSPLSPPLPLPSPPQPQPAISPSPPSLSAPPPLPAGTTPSTILSMPPFSPTRPNYTPTPTSAYPLAPPTEPLYAKSQPLPLPLANGSLPVTSQKQSHTSIGIIFGCIIGGVVLLLMLGLGLIFIFNKNRRNHKNPNLESKDNSKTVVTQDSAQNDWPQGAHVIRVQTEALPLPPPPSSNRGSVSVTSGVENPLQSQAPFVALSSLSSGSFTYDELVSATSGFSEANLIGEGGFGYVHKGFLRNGQEVAVKQLKEGSRQGEREFRAEVEIINQVHHKHLVSLLGYCIAGTKRLLVYEFVPNNTLEFHLHGMPCSLVAAKFPFSL